MRLHSHVHNTATCIRAPRHPNTEPDQQCDERDDRILFLPCEKGLGLEAKRLMEKEAPSGMLPQDQAFPLFDRIKAWGCPDWSSTITKRAGCYNCSMALRWPDAWPGHVRLDVWNVILQASTSYSGDLSRRWDELANGQVGVDALDPNLDPILRGTGKFWEVERPSPGQLHTNPTPGPAPKQLGRGKDYHGGGSRGHAGGDARGGSRGGAGSSSSGGAHGGGSRRW